MCAKGLHELLHHVGQALDLFRILLLLLQNCIADVVHGSCGTLDDLIYALILRLKQGVEFGNIIRRPVESDLFP